MTFHLMFVHYTVSSVWVAEWPSLGKELPTWLAMCSRCIFSVCNLVISPCGFEGGVGFFITRIHVHCLLVAFILLYMSLVLRKPVFGVSDKVRHKSGCTATEDS